MRVKTLLLRSIKLSYSNNKKNLYEMLESSPSASQEQLKNKYYSLVKKYHPDVSKTNTDHIKALNQAYSILSDQKLRSKYDQEQGFNSKAKIYQGGSAPYNQPQSANQEKEPSRWERQTFRSKRRNRPSGLFHRLFQNFIIGMVLTGLLILISGQYSQKKNIEQNQKRPYSKEQFQIDFQNSLMRKPTQ